MWRAVTMTAVLGLGWCGELPQEVPREPPQLPPLDVSDDLFQPGFLSDPHAHFIFAARTDRRDARPQLVETSGNIAAYINRLSRPPHQTTDKSEESINSSVKRNRGTPPPSSTHEPLSFEPAKKNVALQPNWVRPDIEEEPSIPIHIESINARHPGKVFTEERQQAVAPTPKSKDRSRGTKEYSVNQPMWIQVEKEEARTKIEEEVITIRSRPTRPVLTTETEQENEQTTAAVPRATTSTPKSKNRSRGTIEYSSYQPKWVNVEKEQAETKIEEEVSTTRSRPTRPVLTTETAQQYEQATVAVPRATRRRIPVKRKQMPLLEYEILSTPAPGAPRATKPPPPPVPTLSPWIDGYGK